MDREMISRGLSLLPAAMDTLPARVMLLAIGMQESKFKHRRQLVGSPPKPTGPAKSFWQAEMGGGMVHGVRIHASTRDHAAKVYTARGVAADDRAIWDAIENDDALACALARLLLWSDSRPIPAVGNEEPAWEMYLRVWRPGAYSRGTQAQRDELRAKWSQSYAWARGFV